MNFDESFDILIKHEGFYSNNKNDRGGETCYGITKAVAQENNYFGEMHELPLSTAKEIYKKKYWNAIRAQELPDDLRFHVFDCAVNSGVSAAIKLLQKELQVEEDGVIGEITLKEIHKKDSKILAARFNAGRLKYMLSSESWGTFSKGWCNRVISNILLIT